MAFNYSGYAASHPKFGGFFSNRIDRKRPFVSGRVFRPRKAGKDCCFMNVLSLRILRFYKAASSRKAE
jgi:hypothetical protein